MPEAGGTGNPSSPSLRPAAFPGPAGNPIPEAPGRGRSVHLPRACVCVWRGPGLAEENKWGAVGGGCCGQGGGSWLKGRPAAPRNLSAMRPRAWPVFIYAE